MKKQVDIASEMFNALFGHFTKKKQMEIIKSNNDEYIKRIENPCKKAQVALIKLKGGKYIRQFDNPCKKAQMLAVKQNIKYIKYIENPCVKVLDYVRERGGI